MKRRSFLKAASLVPVVAACPSLAKTDEKPLYIFGPTSVEAHGNFLITNWIYRGWEVAFKTKNWIEGAETYVATRGEQYIVPEIDVSLMELYINGGHGTRKDYINSELDAYIEQADVALAEGYTSYSYKNGATTLTWHEEF